MATGRVPTTANSPLTTKGDLFGYSTAPARLAVGADGETIVADSSTATGLRWQGDYAAGKNKVINGDFNIWQRGTSFSNPTSGTYTVDRFRQDFDGTGATRTISRQAFTAGAAPVAGYEGNYFYRYAFTAVGSGNTFCTPAVHRIEDVTTFAGQTVTISFWAKNNTSKSFNVYYAQNLGSGGTGTPGSGSSSITIGTSWARYSVTFNIASLAGDTVGTSSYIEFYIADVAATRAAFTLDMWGWQVEAGSVATAFQTATGTIQGELTACQRYFQVIAEGNSAYIFNGNNWYAFDVRGVYTFPVQMRTAPTLVGTTGTNYYRVQYNTTTDDLNEIKMSSATVRNCLLLNDTQAAVTAGTPATVLTNNASASVAISAEL